MKYKNNVDSIVSSAVIQAKNVQQTNDNRQYAIKAMFPLAAYYSPSSLGSLNVLYPKTWSSYVNTKASNYPLDGYFYPGTLPSVNDSGSTNFALRIRIVPQPYSQILQNYNNFLHQGNITINAYKLPKIPSEVGVELTGKFLDNPNKTVTEVIVPLRSQTLEIWTEGNQYLSIFNTDILPNFSFSP